MSRRIQTLALNSSKDLPMTPSPIDENSARADTTSLTARNLQNNTTERNNSLVQPRPSFAESRASSPNRSIVRAFRSGRSSQKKQQAGSIYSDMSSPRQYETITARIVRKPEIQSIDGAISSNQQHDFQRTPTSISQGNYGSSTFLSFGRPSTMANTARPPSRESNFSTMTKSSWKNFGRRPKESSPPPAMPPQSSRPSFASNDLEGIEESAEDKRSTSSKASKMFKRMSGISNGARQGSYDTRSASLSAATARPGKENAPAGMPSGFPIGDLNVQFPDSLLWKRRWVEVDSLGHLILTASKANDRPQTAFIKKYRLGDFRAPSIPSQERQELPYSIVLDFLEGGTLQLACGDPLSQTSIMKSKFPIMQPAANCD